MRLKQYMTTNKLYIILLVSLLITVISISDGKQHCVLLNGTSQMSYPRCHVVCRYICMQFVHAFLSDNLYTSGFLYDTPNKPVSILAYGHKLSRMQIIAAMLLVVTTCTLYETLTVWQFIALLHG